MTRTSRLPRVKAIGVLDNIGSVVAFYVRKYDDGTWNSLGSPRLMRECYPIVLETGEFIKGTRFSTPTELLVCAEKMDLD